MQKKNSLITAVAVFVLLALLTSCCKHEWKDATCTDCGTLRIGSKGPAGGYIFYDCDLDNKEGNGDGLISSECGWRFLEAAPENIGEAVFGYYRTSSNGKNLYVNGDVNYSKATCTREEIGYGKSNTEMLVDAMEDSAYTRKSGAETTDKYAAKMCADYALNGYNDWFLPSKGELNLMYTNLYINGIGNWGDVFWWFTYWSSSEDSGYECYAWVQDICYGAQINSSRDGYYCVRPVRAF